MCEVITFFIRVGLENKVDAEKKLDDMRKTIVEQSKYEMATLEIKQLMRKNYLVENFEKLARLIRNNNSIEVEEKKKIYSAMEKRIVDLWGEDSPQHKSVKGWMDFNVPKKQK